jgi:hypothetical protein
MARLAPNIRRKVLGNEAALEGGFMRTLYRLLSIVALFALMSGPALRAQEDRQYDPQTDDHAQVDQSQPPLSADADQPAQSARSADVDPPARAARLQYMNGSVSVQPHGTDEWVAGTLNRPLTNSDNIWADKNSRAEISAGTGLIRIDSESSLTLTNVSENLVQMQLHQGALDVHIRRLYDNETYEIDTPNQAFTIRKPGDYRFDVDPNADKTVITVWRGEGEATGDGPTVRIRENQQARFTNGTSMQNDIHGAPAPDSFDEWASARDRRSDRSTSARYVSPDVVGYEDLDEYGTWRDTDEYGHVWVPSGVSVGWSPYRYGHWIWVSPWGWTWVEDEPWGYAPFHYGRWVYSGGYWGWAPGPIYVRPYYSPALVAWFGGPGWGVSVGFGGGYGWCPLGYGEPFIPWYGVSRGYFNRVNITNTHITNVTNITNIYNNTYINNHPKPVGGGGGHGYGVHNNIRYANMHAPNGFTAVSRDTLVNSRPVARNAMRVAPNQLSRISAVHAMDVKPTRTTMLGANAGRSAALPPQRAFSRPTISRAAPQGGSFGQPQATNAGRNVERPQIGNAQSGRGVQRPIDNMPNRGAAPNNNVRMPDRGSVSPRSVPRPPSAGGFEKRGMNQGGVRSMPENNPRSNASRPPSASISRPEMSGPQNRQSPQIAERSNVPRPPSAGMGRGDAGPHMQQPSAPAQRSVEPSRGASPVPRTPERSGGSRSQVSVPRPPSSYEANNRPSPNYGGGSYSRPSPNRGGGSYSRPAPSAAPSYDRGSYGRPAPSYGGGSYSRPAPAPSYGGGSYGRSMPSYGGGSPRSTPSYGGGSGRSMPSYGASRAPSGGGGFGGGGSRPSGGFGGGGGGGHASAPSHSSGGDAGNSHAGGGHHGH